MGVSLLSPNDARAQFPFLEREINGKPCVFLDSAASAQKPRRVIDKLAETYAYGYANIHRGMYDLSNRATDAFEETRDMTARFINARSVAEIVFTRGATEGINLAAHGLAETLLKKDAVILLTGLEHHANLLPWEQAATRTGARIVYVPVREDGGLPTEDIITAIKHDKPAIVAFTAMSNALGVSLPAAEICAAAREAGAITLVDACQAVVHDRVDVQAIDCDLLVFSAHKLYGPSGVGVLYGRSELLNTLPPYQTGGEMVDIADITRGSTFQPAPLRFEAGTPAIAEVIAFAEALRFVADIDRDAAMRQEAEITAFLETEIAALDGYRVIGPATGRRGIVPFVHEMAAPSDIGELCDQAGIALRAGHHCAQPLMRAMGLGSTVRASLAVYNTIQDAEALIVRLKGISRFF